MPATPRRVPTRAQTTRMTDARSEAPGGAVRTSRPMSPRRLRAVLDVGEYYHFAGAAPPNEAAATESLVIPGVRCRGPMRLVIG